MRACSACAGDYEDPDDTAWRAETDDGEPAEADEEEFPAEQQLGGRGGDDGEDA